MFIDNIVVESYDIFMISALKFIPGLLFRAFPAVTKKSKRRNIQRHA